MNAVEELRAAADRLRAAASPTSCRDEWAEYYGHDPDNRLFPAESSLFEIGALA